MHPLAILHHRHRTSLVPAVRCLAGERITWPAGRQRVHPDGGEVMTHHIKRPGYACFPGQRVQPHGGEGHALDGVETQAIVKAEAGQVEEAGHGAGGIGGEQLQFDVADVGLQRRRPRCQLPAGSGRQKSMKRRW